MENDGGDVKKLCQPSLDVLADVVSGQHHTQQKLKRANAVESRGSNLLCVETRADRALPAFPASLVAFEDLDGMKVPTSMIPSASLDAIHLANITGGQASSSSSSSSSSPVPIFSKKRKVDRDRSAMMAGFFREARSSGEPTRIRTRASGGTAVGHEDGSFSSSSLLAASHKLHRSGEVSSDVSRKNHGVNFDSSKDVVHQSSEKYAAEILSRIPSEDLHANSRDWNDENLNGSLTFGASSEGGFNFSAISGEVIAGEDDELGRTRTGSHLLFNRGIMSVDSIDAGVNRWPSTGGDGEFFSHSHSPSFAEDRINSTFRIDPPFSKNSLRCPKCGLLSSVKHVCSGSFATTTPSIRMHHFARKYSIENSNDYNAYMLKKYIGISSHVATTSKAADTHNFDDDAISKQSSKHILEQTAPNTHTPNITNNAAAGRGVLASEEEGGGKYSSSGKGGTTLNRVPIQVRLARSNMVAEMALLSKDAKEHIAQLMRDQLLLLIGRFPHLQHHQEFMEKTMSIQSKLLQEAPVQTLTMTGGGMSMGPARNPTSSSSTGEKTHSIGTISCNNDHDQAPLLMSLFLDMEEYAMTFAMQLKESCEDQLEKAHAKSITRSDDGDPHFRKTQVEHNSNINDNDDESGADRVVVEPCMVEICTLEERFRRFTGQIDNYLGPNCYLHKEGVPRPTTTTTTTTTSEDSSISYAASRKKNTNTCLTDESYMKRYSQVFQSVLEQVKSFRDEISDGHCEPTRQKTIRASMKRAMMNAGNTDGDGSRK